MAKASQPRFLIEAEVKQRSWGRQEVRKPWPARLQAAAPRHGREGGTESLLPPEAEIPPGRERTRPPTSWQGPLLRDGADPTGNAHRFAIIDHPIKDQPSAQRASVGIK